MTDSALGSGTSSSAELQLPGRDFEQEKSVNEASETPESRTACKSTITEEKESSSGHHNITTSSSNHEYITSDSLLLYSCPPSASSNYPRLKVAPENVAGENVATCDNFGDSGMDSGVSGTNSGISGINSNIMGKDTMCMEGQVPSGNMNLLSESELSSLFRPFIDSGLGMEFDGNTAQQ